MTSKTTPTGEDEGIETAQGDAGGEAEHDAGGPHRFDSEKAREAAKKRWGNRRESDAAGTEAAEDEDLLLVVIPVSKGEIVKRLARDAKNGSATAARELRAWLAEYPPQDDHFDPAVLDGKLRRQLYARLLAEEEAAQEEIPAP